MSLDKVDLNPFDEEFIKRTALRGDQVKTTADRSTVPGWLLWSPTLATERSRKDGAREFRGWSAEDQGCGLYPMPASTPRI